MSTSPRSFNADEKTQELLGSVITIGGRNFTPALLTPDLRKQQSEIHSVNQKLIRSRGLDKLASEMTDEQLDTRSESLGTLDDSIYDQVALFIRDENKQSPGAEFLRDHLDYRIANRLLSWLEDRDGDEGESQTATTPSATGA